MPLTIHAILIIIHAAAATLALLAGLISLQLPRLVTTHSGAIVLMTLALIGAVFSRPDTATSTFAINLVLCGIALIMAVQAILAWRRRPGGPSAPMGHHAAVGFNCIGLVTGFVAVSTVHLTTNPLVDVVAPVATVLVCRAALNRFLASAT